MSHECRSIGGRQPWPLSPPYSDFAEPDSFDHLMQKLASSMWIVYAKKPFGRVDHVIQYLGRYTHRVGMANIRTATPSQPWPVLCLMVNSAVGWRADRSHPRDQRHPGGRRCTPT
jgi:hypothetical protein